MFLIGSSANAFGDEFGAEMLTRCRDEMVEELERFRGLVHRHGLSVEDSELARAVAAFSRDPGSRARGLAIQEACRSVLAQLGRHDPAAAGAAGGPPMTLEADGLHALEA